MEVTNHLPPVFNTISVDESMVNFYPRMFDQVDEKSINTPDVFLLGTGDHASLNLISILLNDKNYVAWSQNLMTSLEAKEKEGFIIGRLPRPVVTAFEYIL